MNAQDYQVTQKYGYDPTYPLNNGFHKGVDYGSPVGTPVVVNGVIIGLSGRSGAVVGPHLHVGKFVNGKDTDPKNGGQTFNSAVVFDTGEDPVNGKYVRVTADGALWVYLHLSEVKVIKGQQLKGGSMNDHSQEANDRQAALVTIGKAVSVNYKDLNDVNSIVGNINTMAKRIDELTKIVGDLENKPIQSATVLAPGLYEVKKG